MKRTYIKPAVEILDIETKATCAATSWNVDGGKNPDDRGHVFEDKGDGGEYPDNYNPWDSTDW